MNTYVDFLEKAQAEWLNSLKQAQELNIASLAAMTNLFAQVPTVDSTDAIGSMPTATDVVERSFAFTNQLLETRKQYMVKLAELATETQRQFVETAKRVADTTKN